MSPLGKILMDPVALGIGDSKDFVECEVILTFPHNERNWIIFAGRDGVPDLTFEGAKSFGGWTGRTEEEIAAWKKATDATQEIAIALLSSKEDWKQVSGRLMLSTAEEALMDWILAERDRGTDPVDIARAYHMLTLTTIYALMDSEGVSRGHSQSKFMLTIGLLAKGLIDQTKTFAAQAIVNYTGARPK
jgi:hypothetical protein